MKLLDQASVSACLFSKCLEQSTDPLGRHHVTASSSLGKRQEKKWSGFFTHAAYAREVTCSVTVSRDQYLSIEVLEVFTGKVCLFELGDGDLLQQYHVTDYVEMRR